jgi:ferredoxin-NADP reductase/DMSO/TMAO reductase YedYZ heme-binding membrane subunit
MSASDGVESVQRDAWRMASPVRQRDAPGAVHPAGGRARVEPPVVLGAVAAGAAVVAWLWWRNTPAVVSFGDWLTNAGRLTGLGAGYAIVVALLLMARVPAIDRGIGSDRLARWHASGGRYVVCLSVAHTALIIWGYAVLAHSGLAQETGTLLTSYPDVLMATVALGLLVMVGAVSARAARRRLAYETWHFVHLYTYLAVALAFSHEFATGADFRDVPARVFWSALYSCVGAALVWFRFVMPLITSARHQFRVAGVVRESRDVVSVYVTGRRIAALRAEAGQFFRWRFLTRGLWWAANPYSLSAGPRGDTLRITARLSGEHSAALLTLRPGTRVIAEGPYGSFTAARRRRRRVLLVGAGIGITPLRALFETLPGGPQDVAMVYRATTPDDLVLRHEIDDIAARRGAAVHYVVGRRRHRHDPLTADRLRRLVPDIRDREIYLCGPDALVATLRADLRHLGVPASQLHSESFAF